MANEGGEWNMRGLDRDENTEKHGQYKNPHVRV